MLDYNHDRPQASELTRLVLSELAELGLPPTPIYFTLFYERALRRDASLTKDMDDAINSESGLSLDQAQDLFDRHLLHGTLKQMNQAQETMLRLMRNMMLQMLNTGNEFSNFASTLGNFCRQIDHSDSIESLRELTEELLADTRSVENTALASTEDLNKSSSEINRLKADLEKARQDARTDPLTGLPNRRGLSDSISREIARAGQEGTPAAFLLADIDHFKHINDDYGHLVGDKILRFVARSLKNQLKRQDKILRYGGEEFAILLPETPLKGAEQVAERLRKHIADARLRMAESRRELGQLTISIGVTDIRPADVPDHIILRADDGLLAAKRAGRNRVVLKPAEEVDQSQQDLIDERGRTI